MPFRRHRANSSSKMTSGCSRSSLRCAGASRRKADRSN